MPLTRKRRFRLRAMAMFFSIATIVVLLITITILRIRFHGPALAQLVESAIQGEIRGRIAITSIDWPLYDAPTLLTGGWATIAVKDLKVYDEENQLVIDTPRCTFEVDVHAAIAGNYYLRNAKLDRGGFAKIRELPEPYQAHAYDTSVVSLVSAFYPIRLPGFYSGYSATRKPNVSVQNVEVSGPGIDLEFVFETFTATMSQVTGGGFFYLDASDPLAKKLYYSLAATDTPLTRAESATITANGVTTTLHDIQVHRLGLLPSRWPSELVPRDIRYKMSAHGVGGMRVDVEGAVLDSWIDIFGGDHRLTIKAKNAGEFAELISKNIVGGDHLGVEFRVSGPVLAPSLRADLTNLVVQIPMGPGQPALPMNIARATPTWDNATESGSLEEIIATTDNGGKLQLKAEFQLQPTHFNLAIDIPPENGINLQRYLPPSLEKDHIIKGSTLSGNLAVVGNLDKQRLERLDLRFGAAHISGQGFRHGDRVDATGISVALGRTRIANMHGFLNSQNQTVKLDFDVQSNDANRWFRRFNIPPVASGLRGRVHVEGPWKHPLTRATLVTTGVPIVEKLNLSLGYDVPGKTLQVREAKASALEGWFRGSGNIVFQKIPSIQDVKAQLQNIQLSQLPTVGTVLSGELDVVADVGGTISNPTGTARGTLREWTIAGEKYANTEFFLQSFANRALRLQASIKRKLGGTLKVDASMGESSALTGILNLQDVPIDRILRAANVNIDIGGDFSTILSLGGTHDAPTASGDASLRRSWFGQSFLGSADFNVTTPEKGKIRILGTLLQGRFQFDCLLSTQAPYSTIIALHLQRVELDRFIPKMRKHLGLRGWISGQIRYEGNLMGTKKPTVLATLSDTEFVLDDIFDNGRPTPIRLHNSTPLVLRFDGEILSFVNPLTISGPTGDFILSGSGSREELDFHLDGSIAIGLLRSYLGTIEPTLDQNFEQFSGTVIVSASLNNTLDDYRLVGQMNIEKIIVKPGGQDAIINIPVGKIDFSNTSLVITGLRIAVTDQFSNEVSEISVKGGVRLDNFTPSAWGLVIEGDLAGKLFLLAAPEQFSAASGSAELSINLNGIGIIPSIGGSIEFSDQSPLTLTPRAARRELSFTSGVIFFSDQLIELKSLQATVDDEGFINDISGTVALEDWRSENVDLTISAQDVRFRVPDALDLTVNLNRFRIAGGTRGLSLSGDIEVPEGRYISRFDPLLDRFEPTAATASDSSVFENLPWLGNAALDVFVRSNAFYVDNNVANIELEGMVKIGGTPLQPRFDGAIQVVQGTFQLQGQHVQFERTSGSVHFSPGLRYPAETPYLDISSESDYRSSDGQNHLVKLRLLGPLSNLNWDLSTSAGLNKIQTLQLIYLGRTPEEVRSNLLGDESVTRRPGDIEVQETQSDNRLQAFDQVTKEYSSQWFSSIIGDRLRQATKLDVARLQLGTTSIGVYGEKNLTRSLLFIGEVERSLTSWQWDVNGRYRFNDTGSLDFGYFSRYSDDETDDDDNQGKISVSVRGYVIP